MKRLLVLLLLFATLVPLCAQAEIILFEDENGKVIMSDDGEIEFLPPDENTLQTAAPQPAPTPTPVYSRENWPREYRTLYRGRRGEDVFMLQMRLHELGYYNGSITGGYYGGTIKAVEAFQRDHGLTVDGAAGEKTQALLFSSSVDPLPAETVASGDAAAAADTPMPTLVPTATPLPETTPLPAAAPMLVPEYVPRVPIEDSVG